MRAVAVVSLSGPEAMEVGEHPEPEPGPDQLLVDVHTAGVIFPDVLMTRGAYQLKPPLPFVGGAQLAGTVLAAPADSGFAAGQRVAGFSMLGGFAERAVLSPLLTVPLPDEMTWAEGAAAPTNYLTAEFALANRGRLATEETVLVHGAAGGVGLATVQLAAAFGARVIAVVSTPEKGEAARDSGAHDIVEVDGFRASVLALTDGRGVDVLVDPVGGDRFTDSLRCLAPAGRLLVVGFTGGEIPTVRVNRLLLNNIEVVGAAWGEWALRHPGFVQQQWTRLLPYFTDGSLRPRIGATFPLE
jgi:NADPH2:quinone reductase